MLDMSMNDYARIRRRYPDAMDGDSAADFVADLLEVEAAATRRKHPYAEKTAKRLEEAAATVRLVASDLSGEMFGEDN